MRTSDTRVESESLNQHHRNFGELDDARRERAQQERSKGADVPVPDHDLMHVILSSELGDDFSGIADTNMVFKSSIHGLKLLHRALQLFHASSRWKS